MISRADTQARAVLAIIEDLRPDLNISVYPWHNGRENGVCFTVWDMLSPRNVFVAQCRNSDRITVTDARSSEWDLLTEEEYRRRHYLPSNDYFQAAQLVLKLLGRRA